MSVHIKRLLQRIVLLTLSVAVFSSIASLLAVAVSPLKSELQFENYFDFSAPDDAPTSTERSLEILADPAEKLDRSLQFRMSPGKIWITFIIEFQPNDAWVHMLQNERLFNKNVQDLLFGHIVVSSNEKISLSDPRLLEWSLNPMGDRVQFVYETKIELRDVDRPWRYVSVNIDGSGHDDSINKVEVLLRQARLEYSSSVPVRTTKNNESTGDILRLLFSRKSLGEERTLRFQVSFNEVDARRSGESLLSLLRRMRNAWNDSFVNGLSLALTESLPFLMILAICWSRGPRRKLDGQLNRTLPGGVLAPSTAVVSDFLTAIILFKFAIVAVIAIRDVQYKIDQGHLVDLMNDFDFSRVTQGAAIAGAVLLGILIPAMLNSIHSKDSQNHQQNSTVFHFIAAIVFAIATVASAALVFVEGTVVYQLLVSVTVSLFVVAFYVCYAFTRLLLGQFKIWLALLAAILLLFLACSEPILERIFMPRTETWLRDRTLCNRIIMLFLCVNLAISATMLCLRSFARFSRVSDSRQVRWIAIAFGILVSFPLDWTVGGLQNWSLATELISLSYPTVSFLYLVGYAILFVLLFAAGRESLTFRAITRWIAIVLLAAFIQLSVQTQHIPITLLLAIIIFQLVVLKKSVSEIRLISDLIEQLRPDAIAKAMTASVAKQSYLSRRRALTKQYAIGEIDAKTYVEGQNEAFAEFDLATERNSVIALRGKKQVVATRTVAFGTGPHSSAWENGVHGAKWSLILAAPWMVALLYQLLLRPIDPYAIYPLWGVALGVIYIVAKWLVFGFCFGYLFCLVRGDSGFKKAIWFSAGLMIPQIPSMVMNNGDFDEWRASFVFGAQLLMHMVLMGTIAFDYLSIRHVSSDWRDVLDAHGFTAVGISLSSLLISFGAATAALLTNQASSLISIALKLAVPDFSIDPTI